MAKILNIKTLTSFFLLATFLLGGVGKVAADDAPIVIAFAIPATSTSLTVPVTTLTATDDVAVMGFLVTEVPTSPDVLDGAWIPEAPATYTFADYGTKTLYAWAKDAADNVSVGFSAQVTITPAPTCADGIQNQGETGLDCGGPCGACPVTNPIIPTVQPSQDSNGSSTKKSNKKKKKKKKSSAKFSIANSASSVARGAVLTQKGSKFSKNSVVKLYFSKPGGGFYPPSLIKTSASGGFATAYRVTKPRGSYSWYAVDALTGKRSKTATYRVK